jgi:hypothetical protein
MLLADVNVFIYAHRRDAVDHERFRDWLAAQLSSSSTFAVSELILSSVVRVITNPSIYGDATPLPDALKFVEQVRTSPRTVRIEAGPRHWQIFADLCQQVSAKGNLVAACYYAALAIEHGCEWISVDRHFAQFPGLRWRHPLN